MTTKGIDLSLWDAGENRDIPLDWSRYEWDFAFIKVSEGKVIDPAFEMQWSAARGKAIRGAYHYFRAFVDPKQSVMATLEFMNNDYGELPIAFDLETMDGFPQSHVMQQAKSWLSWYEEFTGIRPIIYSRRLFLRDELKSATHDWLKNYKLWLAEYYFDRMSPVASRNQRLTDVLNGVYVPVYPVPPAPFSRVSFFQFSEFGQPEKIPGYYLGYGHKLQVDLNLYDGTREQMLDEFKIDGGTTTPPTEPTGGTMPGYKCIKAVNVRNASNVVVAALKVGDRIWGTAGLLKGLQRVTFNKIYRATGVVDTWTNCNAAINDGSVVFLQAISDQEPNTTPPPSGVVITSVTVNYTEDGVQKIQTLP